MDVLLDILHLLVLLLVLHVLLIVMYVIMFIHVQLVIHHILDPLVQHAKQDTILRTVFVIPVLMQVPIAIYAIALVCVHHVMLGIQAIPVKPVTQVLDTMNLPTIPLHVLFAQT